MRRENPHLLLLFGVLAGCHGTLTEPGSGPGGPFGPGADCTEPATPAAEPLRRISGEQYENVLRDLVPGALGDELVQRSTFPATVITRGFSTDAQANSVNTSESNAIEDNAELLANYVLDHADTAIPQLTSCVAPGFDDAALDGCLDPFLDDFGARAYRRPLTDGERTILTGVYDSIRPDQGARAAFASVLQVLLQAPALLYRVERGQPGAGPAVALTSHEMASRLSFFLRSSMPDEALVEVAERGELATVEEVEAQAARMVEDDAVLASLRVFHRDWLRQYQIGRTARAHPLFSPEVQAALEGEIDGFVDHVFGATDGTFATLMTTTRFPVSATLGPLYGVDGANGAALDVPHRHGILTLASVLGGFAEEDHTSAIRRGAFVREALLCGDALTLPGNVDVSAALESTAGLPTARDRLEPITSEAACAHCHRQINPLGLGLENYDQLGAWRDDENGVTIDASGTLAVNGLDGRFADPAALVELIASSEQAQACYATQMFRFAMGRLETDADACALAGLQQRFIDSGGDVRDLMVGIATSQPFMTRAPVQD
ncbi:MAG: DUF1592 domain-containing protein [Sandaracinaceae bacterium]